VTRFADPLHIKSPTMPSTLRRQLIRFALLGLSLSALAPLAQAQADRVYHFSPVNQYGIELTARYWNPIVDYVSSKSGVKLQLKIGRTSADTTAYVLANEVEFIFSNHLFSPDRDHLGWKVFGRRDAPPIRSQLIVVADSPIQKVEQLANLPVSFPGPEATVAYKHAYAQLLTRNVPVQVVFGGNSDGALAQLASGKVKASGTHSQLSEGWSKREGKAVRVLWQSEPLLDLALMAAKNVPDKDVQAVGRAFFGMARDPEGQKVLAAAAEMVKLPASTAFVPAAGADYAAYRNFYQTAPAALH
jgi:phosphonate transport system substrate-binding protein